MRSPDPSVQLPFPSKSESPQDGIQNIEVIMSGEIIEIRKEGTQSLWMGAVVHMTMHFTESVLSSAKCSMKQKKNNPYCCNVQFDLELRR